jgi:hypothetical protein
MEHCGHFTANKPAKYWYLVLRNLWRDNLDNSVSEESPVEVDETQELLHRDNYYVTPVPESTHPIQSVINFLLVTLHLSFVCMGVSAYSADAPTGERSEASWREDVRIVARSGTISITLSKLYRR